MPNFSSSCVTLKVGREIKVVESLRAKMAGERRGQGPACVIVIIINLSWGRHNVNNCYTFALAPEIKKCQARSQQ